MDSDETPSSWAKTRVQFIKKNSADSGVSQTFHSHVRRPLALCNNTLYSTFWFAYTSHALLILYDFFPHFP